MLRLKTINNEINGQPGCFMCVFKERLEQTGGEFSENLRLIMIIKETDLIYRKTCFMKLSEIHEDLWKFSGLFEDSVVPTYKERM